MYYSYLLKKKAFRVTLLFQLLVLAGITNTYAQNHPDLFDNYEFNGSFNRDNHLHTDYYTTEYTWVSGSQVNGLTTGGKLTIGSEASNYNYQGFFNCIGHGATTSSSNAEKRFLIVNGCGGDKDYLHLANNTPSNKKIIQYQVQNVQPNVMYDLKFWATNLSDGQIAQLPGYYARVNFRIQCNGSDVQTTQSGSPVNWEPLYTNGQAVWRESPTFRMNSGNSTQLLISFYDDCVYTTDSGDDFGIDDVSLRLAPEYNVTAQSFFATPAYVAYEYPSITLQPGIHFNTTLPTGAPITPPIYTAVRKGETDQWVTTANTAVQTSKGSVYIDLDDNLKFHYIPGSNANPGEVDCFQYRITRFGLSASATITVNISEYHQDDSTYDIVAVSNPTEGGAVNGFGIFLEGTLCTLTAMANEGYSFANWTEGDETVVSNEAVYTFTVTEDKKLVANFTPKSYSVTASLNLLEGGTVTGTGTYYHGASATLTATANEDYDFVYWTEDGTVVSTEAVYTFTVTGNRDLVANFTLSSHPITYQWTPTGVQNLNISGPVSAISGSDVTVTYTSNVAPYLLASLTAQTGETNISMIPITSGEENKRKFIMPDGDVVVTAVYQAIELEQLPDIFQFQAPGVPGFNIPTADYTSYAYYVLKPGGVNWDIYTPADFENSDNFVRVGQWYYYLSITNPFGTFQSIVMSFQVNLNHPPHWVLTQHLGLYGLWCSDNMIGTVIIMIDGELIQNTNYELAAFIGYELVSDGYFPDPENNFVYYPVLNGYDLEEDEEISDNHITFRIYDHEEGRELDMVSTTMVVYSDGGMVGSPLYPLVVNFFTHETRFELVNDASELQYGDLIVIADADGNYVMNTDQEANYRGASEATVSNGILTWDEGVEFPAQIIELYKADPCPDGQFALFVNDGYLWAAGDTQDRLGTGNNPNNANYVWTFDITDGEAEIVAQGTNLHNVLSFDSEVFFTCHTDMENPVSIYKMVLTPSIYTVSLTTDPPAGGIVAGVGTYEEGTEVTITATPNTPYSFVYWVNNDTNEVITENPYTFNITEDVELVASFSTEVIQTSELIQGWNWWTPTVQCPLAQLERALGTSGLTIQSEASGSCSYANGHWSGTLGSLVHGQMYRIKTDAACTMSVTGAPVASVEVSLAPGVHWFGYTGSASTNVDSVFDVVFNPTLNDKVISQNEGFAIFNGISWEGTLTTLIPGKGYIYVSRATETKTVLF